MFRCYSYTFPYYSPHSYGASWYYQSFIYSPTDAPVSCLKKTILKFTLNSSDMFRCYSYTFSFYFPHSYRASWYYQSFIYSPTDAPVSCLKKTILKFTLKFTLKQLRHVSVLQLHISLLFSTFLQCVLILSKFYLFTNWCTSELS